MSNSLRIKKKITQKYRSGTGCVCSALQVDTLETTRKCLGSEPSPTGAQKGIHSPRLRHKEESDEKMTTALKGMTQSGMRNQFLCFCFEVFRPEQERGQGCGDRAQKKSSLRASNFQCQDIRVLEELLSEKCCKLT